MKRLLDCGFILALLIFAGAATLIGMVAGPFGYEAESMGASFSACIICVLVVAFGFVHWKKQR